MILSNSINFVMALHGNLIDYLNSLLIKDKILQWQNQKNILKNIQNININLTNTITTAHLTYIWKINSTLTSCNYMKAYIKVNPNRKSFKVENG